MPAQRKSPQKKKQSQQLKIQTIYQLLKKEFGEVHTPLKYKHPYELGIAVILSAQCTDDRVNQITPNLFQAFPSLESFANANPSELEKYIYSSGFYKNKAKSIIGYAKLLKEKFNSELPKTINELIQLPGFGRKTANVVLNELYGISEGFVVDTHVKRVAYRLGLTKFTNPIRIEKEIMETVPKKYWKDLSLYLIFHGRKTCKAKKPLCSTCFLSNLCKYNLTKDKN